MGEINQTKKTNHCLIYIGIIFIISGLSSVIFWPMIFKCMIHSQRILDPSSPFLSYWLKTPIPLTYNVYFWNWTNPEDINNSSIKPRFEEVGPLSYKQIREKVQVVWNDNNTVSYKLVKSYFFDKENSKASLNATVTSIDTVARSVAYIVRNWNIIAKKGISLSLMKLAPTIEITKQLDEFLFRGYHNIIVDFARQTAFATGLIVPEKDKVGYLYGVNGSAEVEGEFNMATGKGKENAGDLLKWRYKTHTGYYPGKCGEVRGSVGGELFPPGLTKDDISAFSSEQARHFKMKYEDEQEVEGIRGYKYIGGAGMMDNGSKILDNACYCIGECLPSGAVNLSTTISGVPAFMTFPHFYDADPYYSGIVDGMKPDRSKHLTYVIAEPTTGIPLEGAIRIQINILLEPDEYISMYRKVPRTFIPVFWLEEKVRISKPMASLLKSLLQISTIVNVIGFLLMLIGCICVAIAIMQPINKLFSNLLYKNENNERIQEKEEMPLRGVEE